MGNAKLQAKRTTTSLDINNPQTSGNPQTSDVVSTSKYEKSPFSFLDAWTACAFIGTGVSNANAESVRHLLGLDSYGLTKLMYDSLLDFFEKMKPRDDLDLLALQQLYLHHLRAIGLCAKAYNKPDVEKGKILHEAADSASNTFRRLMKSFDERRKPPRQSIVVGQTNVVEQQVVQNIHSDGQKKSPTN